MIHTTPPKPLPDCLYHGPLRPQDSAAAAALHHHLFPPSIAWSLKSFEETIGSDGTFAWCLKENQTHQMMGCIVIKTVLDEGEILTIAVHPTYQRQGCGHFLLDQGMMWARDDAGGGIAKLYLEVSHTNIVAQKLYKKIGFRPISTRKKYYQVSKKEAEDAFVFCLDL